MESYEGYSWIKVKRHKYDLNKSWEENYRDLDQHHVAETRFLIDKVRELAARLEAADQAGTAPPRLTT